MFDEFALTLLPSPCPCREIYRVFKDWILIVRDSQILIFFNVETKNIRFYWVDLPYIRTHISLKIILDMLIS